MEPLLFTPSIGTIQVTSNQKRKAPSDGNFNEEATTLADLSSTSLDEDSDSDAVAPLGYPAAPLQRSLSLPLSDRADAIGWNRRPQRNLKYQHLAAVDAVLHKSLLGGDYDTASTAFAILLRLNISQSGIDLRKRDLWGIGAEILLLRGIKSRLDKTPRMRDNATPLFEEGNFKSAKAYFERLILQYPHRKHRPHDINEVQFSLAMFGVWIYQIQSCRYTKAGSAVQSWDQNEREGTDNSQMSEQKVKMITGQLKNVREVASQIADLTRLPPFDRYMPMLRLQTDVLEWMAHLSQGVYEDSNLEG